MAEGHKLPSEFELIRLLSRQLGASSEFLHPFDDCAVIPFQNQFLLLTTDSMREGVHFRPELSSAKEIGFKLMMRSLSDISAMGGKPRGALLSLSVPRSGVELEWLEELYRGIDEASALCACPVVGGDLSRGEKVDLVCTILGETSFNPIRRSHAAEGQDLWVSGKIGGAAVGLSLLKGELAPVELPAEVRKEAIERYQRPPNRLGLGEKLARLGVSAMIDCSDGLVQDACQLAELSGLGLTVNLDRLPLVARPTGGVRDKLYKLQLSGGDDYELVFSACPGLREQLEALSTQNSDCRLMRVGQFSRLSDNSVARLRIVKEDGTEIEAKSLFSGGALGFNHFNS